MKKKNERRIGRIGIRKGLVGIRMRIRIIMRIGKKI